jgi:lysozyme family protein/peptidoglycan hydrolase-like protein with peptidoglycan-binding domain
MAQDFESLKSEYAGLWQGMHVRPERAASVDQIARRLISLKPRYEAVARSTGVPWAVIAVLHQRESDADFATHLHNGDPLTERTRHVPAGRPEHGNPPFQWEESAIDALTMPPHSLHLVKDWTIERACYEIEKYNGFGYRNNHPEVKSPYLWSFSNQYDRGKYVADGRFDAGTVDQQCGTMPILQRIMELDPSVQFGSATVVPTVDAGVLTIGSVGERVRQLQAGLGQLGFAVGEIDGEFGPITAAAVTAFQSAHGLPATGVADQATQQAISAALATAGGVVQPGVPQPQDILQVLLTTLLARAQTTTTPGASTQQDTARNVLRLVLGALMGAQPAPAQPAQPGATPDTQTGPILSPIDKMLGGEAMVGKKTALAVVAYVVLAILQAAGVVGAATPAGQIITILITAFGALGGIAKVDRGIQSLGMIAAKPPF